MTNPSQPPKRRKKHEVGQGVRSHIVVGRYHLIATKYHPMNEKNNRLRILEWTIFHGSMIIGIVRQEERMRYVASWPDGTAPVVASDPRAAARALLGG